MAAVGREFGLAFAVGCASACVALVLTRWIVGPAFVGPTMVAVILAWGACDAPCPEDVTGDGVVDVLDLTQVILNWGACP